MEDRAFNSNSWLPKFWAEASHTGRIQIATAESQGFYHDAWSRNIRGLVDEILEIEIRLTSEVLTSASEKNIILIFTRLTMKTRKKLSKRKGHGFFDYSKGYIQFSRSNWTIAREPEYEDLAELFKPKNNNNPKRSFCRWRCGDKNSWNFQTRDFEAKIRFPKGEYKKEHLPPENEIKEIVVNSMRKVGIKSGVLTEDNANRIFKAFQTLFRARDQRLF